MTARIPLRTPEDVWTATERGVSLWDVLEAFPADAVGPRGPKDAPRPYAVRPVVIDTDLGWSFESDIQYGTWRFRPRPLREPGMLRWCRERGLQPGDTVVFEPAGDHRFRLRLERSGSAISPSA